MSDTIDRSIGLKRDTVADGSDYDEIVANHTGDIPAPDHWLATTGGSFNKNITRNTRENEITGNPAQRAPQPWTARPTLTVPMVGYFDQVVRLIQQAFGLDPTRAGVAPAAFTDTLKPLPLRTSAEAPRFHAQIVRDSLTYRASGCVWTGFNLDLPAADDASIEGTLEGLFYQQRPSSEDPGVPSFSLPERALRLADVSVFIDGGLETVPDVITCGLQFTQDYDEKYDAGHNRVPDPDSPCSYVHMPRRYKRRPRHTVTPRLTLGETNEVEEFKQDFSRAESLVFEIEECPIATTPAAVRMVRITVPKNVWTDGGAGDLSAADDITSPFTGTAGYDDVEATDIKVEVVHNTTTLFTA
jgi:hypothetical protein